MQTLNRFHVERFIRVRIYELSAMTLATCSN